MKKENKKTTKKEIIANTTTATGNGDALQLIKQSIATARESYKDFIAGGTYLVLHDEKGRDALADYVKSQFTDSEWQDVKRQYNRKITACATLAKYRAPLLDNMTAREIREWLGVNNITAQVIQDIEKAHKTTGNGNGNGNGQPKTTGNGNGQPDAIPPADHEGESYNGLPYEMKSIIDELDCLKAAESEMLKDYYAKQGRVFIFRKMNAQEIKSQEKATATG